MRGIFSRRGFGVMQVADGNFKFNFMLNSGRGWSGKTRAHATSTIVLICHGVPHAYAYSKARRCIGNRH